MNIPTVGSPTLDIQATPRSREGKAAVPTQNIPNSPSTSAAHDSTNANAKQETSRQSNSEQLRDAVKEINRAMQQSNRALEFSVDEESDRLVVKLKDGETGEVIRQIPSDETLAISRYIADVQQGLLLSQKA